MISYYEEVDEELSKKSDFEYETLEEELNSYEKDLNEYQKDYIVSKKELGQNLSKNLIGMIAPSVITGVCALAEYAIVNDLISQYGNIYNISLSQLNVGDVIEISMSSELAVIVLIPTLISAIYTATKGLITVGNLMHDISNMRYNRTGIIDCNVNIEQIRSEMENNIEETLENNGRTR